jgi:hypothetical protein
MEKGIQGREGEHATSPYFAPFGTMASTGTLFDIRQVPVDVIALDGAKCRRYLLPFSIHGEGAGG